MVHTKSLWNFQPNRKRNEQSKHSDLHHTEWLNRLNTNNCTSRLWTTFNHFRQKKCSLLADASTHLLAGKCKCVNVLTLLSLLLLIYNDSLSKENFVHDAFAVVKEKLSMFCNTVKGKLLLLREDWRSFVLSWIRQRRRRCKLCRPSSDRDSKTNYRLSVSFPKYTLSLVISRGGWAGTTKKLTKKVRYTCSDLALLINPTGFCLFRSCRRRSLVRSIHIFIALPANNRRCSFGSRMKEWKVSSPFWGYLVKSN